MCTYWKENLLTKLIAITKKKLGFFQNPQLLLYTYLVSLMSRKMRNNRVMSKENCRFTAAVSTNKKLRSHHFFLYNKKRLNHSKQTNKKQSDFLDSLEN